MNKEERYLKELEQAYIDNANDDEHFAELFVSVSYEADCIEILK